MSDRPARVAALFGSALELPAGERRAFLAEACGADEVLRAEIESLLAHVSARTDLLALDGSGDALGKHVQDALAELVPERPPERIGSYRILDVLGVGGMGIVYRAEQEHPRREVALKIVRPGFVSEASTTYFEREISLLGRLDHPGIAHIHEAGRAELGGVTWPYYAMELVDGQPLLAYAQERGLDVRARLELFVRIVDAVHHAHQRGVVHRDLKPSNVLVTAEGEPKVLDFGIAISTDLDVQATSLVTDSKALVGTLATMSPEQALGDSRKLDNRTDVYSLGVMLYELSSGAPPYSLDGLTIFEALRVVREEEPLRLGVLDRALAGDVESIVAKALEKDRELRYGSAAELALDIRRHLADEPILARSTTTLYQLRKFARRNRVLVGGVLGIVVALAVGLVIALAFWTRASGAERRALSVSAIARLEDLEASAERDLWPKRPERIADMEAWLARARQLAKELPTYREDLRALRAEASRYEDGTPRFDDERRAWLFGRLTALVEELEAFGDPESGRIADVEARLAFARTIVARSIDDHTDEWREAKGAIAVADAYGGLDLAPQVGLVPLGRDPGSGFWEFWHVESGARPERDPATGVVRVGEESGVVLVLLPGGTYRMGAQDDDPAAPNYDPRAQPDHPVRSVTLEPFFLGKYELTQGQWIRLTGENPSQYTPAQAETLGVTLANPVETVSWSDCDRTLFRAGLRLPLDVEWEYAARGGTDTPWWTGGTVASLRGLENLQGRTWELYAGEPAKEPTHDDGYVFHAPVGSLAPNRFGLYDVVGNVMEFCADWFSIEPERDPFSSRPDDRDTNIPKRVVRGSAWFQAASMGRAASRTNRTPSARQFAVGVRAARAVEGGG